MRNSCNQKTFNRLIQTVKDLQSQQDATNRDLDLALQFYYATIKPDEAALLQGITERITIAYQFYKTPKALSKNELKIFKMWLAGEVSKACSIPDFNEISAELKVIFKELNGFDYEEILAQELEATKDEIRERFKRDGIDVDLSDIKMHASHEEIMRNIFQKMGETAFEQMKTSRQAPKTKKQLEKELKKRAFEEMQKKSLSGMYKQLVRVLHPDLEQNPEQKIWKEELMKKLTIAYDHNDLYSLLTIEMEWMNRSAGKMQAQNDEELKMYNTILKDQVRELQAAIDMLVTHPRYIPIQRFYPDRFDGISTIQKQYNDLKKLIQKDKELILLLRTSEAKTIFKEIIGEQIEMQKIMSQRAMRCRCGSC